MWWVVMLSNPIITMLTLGVVKEHNISSNTNDLLNEMGMTFAM